MEYTPNNIINDITESLFQAEHLEQTNYELVLRTIQSIVDNKIEAINKHKEDNYFKQLFLEEIEGYECKIKEYNEVTTMLNNVQMIEQRVDTITENQIVILALKVGEFTFDYEYTRGQASSHYILKYKEENCEVYLNEIEKNDFNHNKSYKKFYAKTKIGLCENDFNYFVSTVFRIMFDH